MKVVTISDTHSVNYHEQLTIPECDLLIHAGDFTYGGRHDEVIDFLDWYQIQPAKKKILICGNHEKEIGKNIPLLILLCENRGITLLHNSYTSFEGNHIFGSPYSVEFGNWAFGRPDSLLVDIWNQISPNTDILVVHGPPHGILDRTRGGVHPGSETLLERIKELPNLKLVVFGHIHESRGIIEKDGVIFVNASVCGIPYSDLNLDIRVVEIE